MNLELEYQYLVSYGIKLNIVMQFRKYSILTSITNVHHGVYKFEYTKLTEHDSGEWWDISGDCDDNCYSFEALGRCVSFSLLVPSFIPTFEPKYACDPHMTSGLPRNIPRGAWKDGFLTSLRVLVLKGGLYSGGVQEFSLCAPPTKCFLIGRSNRFLLVVITVWNRVSVSNLASANGKSFVQRRTLAPRPIELEVLSGLGQYFIKVYTWFCGLFSGETLSCKMCW